MWQKFLTFRKHSIITIHSFLDLINKYNDNMNTAIHSRLHELLCLITLIIMKKPKILHLNSIRNSQRGVTHKLNLKCLFGVPTLAQWVKNLTAGAWVTAEVHVQTPTWHSGIKDPALPQCQHQWPLWPRLYFSLSDAFSRLQVISSLCFFVCSSLLFSL